MKTVSVSVLALAGTASATFWNDAVPYSNPANTDNTCNTEQSSGGFEGSWGNLMVGSYVESYGGLYFGGAHCTEAGSFGKRALGGRFAPRNFGKALGGSCGKDKSSSFNMGCASGSSGSSSGSSFGSSSGSQDVSAFSIDSFSIYTEFDCDLEFQYTMGDGSSCRHRSACSSQGSSVKNSQCGGATNLTIVYPGDQTGNNIPPESSTCAINLPTVSFSCGAASSTVAASTTPSASPAMTSTAGGEVVTPGSGSPSGFTPSASQLQPTPTNVGGGSTAYSASTLPVVTPSAPMETPSVPVETPPGGPSYPTESAPVVVVPTPSAPASSAMPKNDSTSFQVSTYVGPSTVYSTSYATITSCAPEITDCPIKSGETAVTTVIVAIETTICPITETHTAVYSSGASTPYASGVASTYSNSPAEESPTPLPDATTVLPVPPTPVVPPVTTETIISCPAVLPACIATWNCK